MLVAGITSDVLYPLDERRFMAGAMPHATLKVVRTMQGHDGFLLEQDQVSAAILRHFDRTARPPRPAGQGDSLDGGRR